MDGFAQLPSLTVQVIPPSTGAGASTGALAALAALPAGSLLRGTVGQRDALGNVLLRTEKGVFSLKTDLPVTRGVELVIRLDERRQDLFARVVSVDGQSVAKFLEAISGQASGGDTVVRNALLPQEGGKEAPGSAPSASPSAGRAPPPQPALLTAIILTPAPEAAAKESLPEALRAALPRLQPGQQLSVRVVELLLPKPGAAMGTASPAEAHLSAAPPSAPAAVLAAVVSAPSSPPASALAPLPVAASDVAAGAPPSAPPRSPASVLAAAPAPEEASLPLAPPAASARPPLPPIEQSRLLAAYGQAAGQRSFTPVSSPALPPLPPVHAGAQAAADTKLLAATVLGGNATNGLILHSDIGTLRLYSPATLQPGTQLALEVVSASESPDAGEPPAAPGGRPYAVLEEIAAYAQAAQGHAGGTARLVPHPGKDMAAEMVFLISALKGGDLRKWLGDARFREMERANPDLLGRLSAEWNTLKNAAASSPEPMQWNSLTLPYAAGAHMETLRLFWRQHREGSAPGESGGGSSEHFIVDTQFSRVGQLQLDGFIKRVSGAPKPVFDLAVRTERPLPEAMRQGIRGIFQESQALTGFSGGLVFHAGKEAVFRLDSQPRSGTAAHGSIIA